MGHSAQPVSPFPFKSRFPSLLLRRYGGCFSFLSGYANSRPGLLFLLSYYWPSESARFSLFLSLPMVCLSNFVWILGEYSCFLTLKLQQADTGGLSAWHWEHRFRNTAARSQADTYWAKQTQLLCKPSNKATTTLRWQPYYIGEIKWDLKANWGLGLCVTSLRSQELFSLEFGLKL